MSAAGTDGYVRSGGAGEMPGLTLAGLAQKAGEIIGGGGNSYKSQLHPQLDRYICRVQIA